MHGEVTRMAYAMVTRFGMSDKIGQIAFKQKGEDSFNMTNPYSDATAQLIDEEARKIVDEAYTRVKTLLKTHMKELELVKKKKIINV